MKKLLSLLLTIILCLTLAFSLTACDDECKHTYTENVVPPTCTESGFVVYVCDLCGHSYSQIIDALGHYYRDVVVPPTCLMPGYTSHVCDCGDRLPIDTNQVAPKGHDFVDGVCTVCGKPQKNQN